MGVHFISFNFICTNRHVNIALRWVQLKIVCEVKSDYVRADIQHKLSFYAYIYGNLDYAAILTES